MTPALPVPIRPGTPAFIPACPTLEGFGLKFTPGGAHISRTMMLAELQSLLSAVSPDATAAEYRDAIVLNNVLGKTTVTTRQKSLRHLRELYALDPNTPIFRLLRQLHGIDAASLPLLALQVAWARDPLLRATTGPILEASQGDRIESSHLSKAVEEVFPCHYTEAIRDKVGRNAGSSWTQSGHLVGRATKTRGQLRPSTVTVTLALFLGQVAGFHGATVFTNPWCRLLDLSPEEARRRGSEAHRAGLLNLRAVGDVVEIDFPLLTHHLPNAL